MGWVHPPPWFTVDTQSIHCYEGASTILHLPRLHGGGFTQLMLFYQKMNGTSFAIRVNKELSDDEMKHSTILWLAIT